MYYPLQVGRVPARQTPEKPKQGCPGPRTTQRNGFLVPVERACRLSLAVRQVAGRTISQKASLIFMWIQASDRGVRTEDWLDWGAVVCTKQLCD